MESSPERERESLLLLSTFGKGKGGSGSPNRTPLISVIPLPLSLSLSLSLCLSPPELCFPRKEGRNSLVWVEGGIHLRGGGRVVVVRCFLPFLPSKLWLFPDPATSWNRERRGGEGGPITFLSWHPGMGFVSAKSPKGKKGRKDFLQTWALA